MLWAPVIAFSTVHSVMLLLGYLFHSKLYRLFRVKVDKSYNHRSVSTCLSFCLLITPSMLFFCNLLMWIFASYNVGLACYMIGLIPVFVALGVLLVVCLVSNSTVIASDRQDIPAFYQYTESVERDVNTTQDPLPPGTAPPKRVE